MEDVYVTCPFDKSHRILRARMLTHLTKCKKRYTKQNKMTCPFNPHHIVDKDEFQHHFNTCPARESAIYCPNVNDEDQPVKAPQLLPIVSQPVWDGEEWGEDKWEDEVEIKYDPAKLAVERPVLRIMVGGSRRERKLFREQERLRRAKLENAMEREAKEQNYANDRAGQSVKSTQLKPLISQSEWQSEDAWDEVKWEDDSSVKSFNRGKSEEKPQVRTIIFDEPEKGTKSWKTKEQNYYANDRGSQSVKSTQLKPKVSQSEWQSEDAWDEVKWEDDMSVKREQEPVRRLQPQNFMERWPKAEEKQKELEDDEEEYRPLRRPRNPPIAIASLRAANNRIKTVQNTSAYENKASSNFSFREQERFCRV